MFDLRALLGISNDLMQSCARDISAVKWSIGLFSSIGIWPNHHVTAAMEAKTMKFWLCSKFSPASRDVNEMSSGEARRMLIGRAWFTIRRRWSTSRPPA